MRLWRLAAALVLTAAVPVGAIAQTVKVGVINTYSGPFAGVGEQLDRGIRLYMKQHEKDLPAGVKIELIRRDDTGPNPEVAKRLAQELITRDHVQLLTGVGVHAVCAVGRAAGDRGQAAGHHHECRHVDDHHEVALSRARIVHAVAIELSARRMGGEARHQEGVFGRVGLRPGHRREAAFTKGFTDNGGQMAGAVRVPVANPDFTPFLQRAKDAKPDAVFAFVPPARRQRR